MCTKKIFFISFLLFLLPNISGCAWFQKQSQSKSSLADNVAINFEEEEINKNIQKNKEHNNWLSYMSDDGYLFYKYPNNYDVESKKRRRSIGLENANYIINGESNILWEKDIPSFIATVEAYTDNFATIYIHAKSGEGINQDFSGEIINDPRLFNLNNLCETVKTRGFVDDSQLVSCETKNNLGYIIADSYSDKNGSGGFRFLKIYRDLSDKSHYSSVLATLIVDSFNKDFITEAEDIEILRNIILSVNVEIQE